MEVDYIPPELTPGAKKSIQDFISRSQEQGPEYFINQDKQAMEPAKGLLVGDDSYNKSIGANSALSGAIRSKYRKGFAQSQRQEDFNSKIDAHNKYFSRLQTAALLSSEEYKLNEQRRIAIYKAKMNKKAARGRLVGTLLGIAGAVVGAYAGGPMGASAGFAAGQGAGNAIGGT